MAYWVDCSPLPTMARSVARAGGLAVLIAGTLLSTPVAAVLKEENYTEMLSALLEINVGAQMIRQNFTNYWQYVESIPSTGLLSTNADGKSSMSKNSSSAQLFATINRTKLEFKDDTCKPFYGKKDKYGNLYFEEGKCEWAWQDANANLLPYMEKLEYVTNEFESFYLLIGGVVGMIIKAGYSMRHSGLCRCKNQFATVMANLFDGMVGAIVFYVMGFGWAMGEDDYVETTSNGLMGMSLYAHDLNGRVDHDDAIVWAKFLFLFALCSQSFTIMSGGIMERMTLWGYLCVVVVFTAMAWPTIAHAVWNEGGVFYAYRDSNLVFECGAIDHLGGGAVHMAGGCAALAGNLVLGPRLGRFSGGGDSAGPRKMMPFVQCSPPFVAMGSYFIVAFTVGLAMFSFESMNFDAGQLLSGVQSAINVVFATFAGALTALVGGLIKDGRTSKDRILSYELVVGGMMAAAAAVSSGAPYYDQVCAAYIGGGAAVAYIIFGRLVNILRIDDASSAIAINLIGGAWGLVATGIFLDANHYTHVMEGVIDPLQLIPSADDASGKRTRIDICMGLINPSLREDGDVKVAAYRQLEAQIAYMVLIAMVMIPFMYIVFLIVEEMCGLRVDPDMEKDGIDRHFYGGMINSVPQRLNVAMHDKSWMDEPDYETVQRAQEDDHETSAIMSKVKKVQKKALQQQKMSHDEKQLTYMFKLQNSCLFVKHGQHAHNTSIALNAGKQGGLSAKGGAHFSGEYEDAEDDPDFFVTNAKGVFYLPQSAIDLQNQIMEYYMNVHQCGRQKSKQGDGMMMSPAESAIRQKYYWHGMGADFDTAALNYERAERAFDKKGALKQGSAPNPANLIGEGADADQWAVYAGSFTEPVHAD
mmetsp:Transcript_72896/g.207669  ORF Transcript_72896/g.207669 Transcript_72896/m.207669 type:complete len:869 (-) Transcript_72896:118-2724(-)